jgi:6-phosphogluconolactonase
VTQAADLLVGSYARLGGGGVYPLGYRDGDWTVGAPIRELVDASWGLRLRDGYVFVEEGDEGRIVFTDAALHVVARRASGGAAPCHLAAGPDGQLAVANYGDGTVALLSRNDGPVALHRSDGHGPDAERQEGPHAHWVGFDPDAGGLYYVDLGSDRIRMLPVAGMDLAEPHTVYQAPAGSGPRHLAWHPHLPVAYLVSELAATVTVIDRVAPGAWRARAILPTLPPGVVVDTLGGAIAIDAAGTRLYVTNRGHDSVVAYGIDADGGLTYRDHRPSGGGSPRFLLLLEDAGRLLVANEEGGSVASLPLDAGGGFAGDPTIIAIPGAVFALRRGDPA